MFDDLTQYWSQHLKTSREKMLYPFRKVRTDRTPHRSQTDTQVISVQDLVATFEAPKPSNAVQPARVLAKRRCTACLDTCAPSRSQQWLKLMLSTETENRDNTRMTSTRIWVSRASVGENNEHAWDVWERDVVLHSRPQKKQSESTPTRKKEKEMLPRTRRTR